MKHRILSMLALPLIAVSGAWAQGPWTSGDCTVTFNDATLTISGNGAMEEVMEDVPGWFSTLRSVDRVVVEEGVTTLCPYAFYGEKKGFVDSFTLPSTLTKIGMAAFAVQNDEAFTTITIPANVTEIGDNAFAMCSNLAVINCYANPAKLVCGDYIFTCEDFPQFHVPSNYYDQYVADFSDKMNVSFVGDLPAQGSTVTTGYKVELTALFEYDGADPEEGDGSTVVSSLPIEKTMLGWFHIVNPEFEPDAEVSIDDASGPSITVGEDHSWNTLVTVGAPGTYTVHAHWVGSDFVGDYITITAVVSELGQEPVPVTVTAGETANQWTLDMPAGNVEVSVEYYQPAELAWKQGTAAVPEGGVSAYMGFPTTLPALANPNSHTVSYTSSNPAAATIDADGKITLVGAGTTTIQATFAGDDTYEETSASYTLNVFLPATLTLKSSNDAWGTVTAEGAISNKICWNREVMDVDNTNYLGAGATFSALGITYTCTASESYEGLYTDDDQWEMEDGAYIMGNATFTSTVGKIAHIEIPYSVNAFTPSDLAAGWSVSDHVLTWDGEPTETVIFTGGVAGIRSITYTLASEGESAITAIDNGNGTYSIIPGTEVTAKATPADGYHLDCWSNNAEVNDAGTQTFTMGEDDMELTAFFEDNTPTNVATFAAANIFTIEGGKAVVKVNADARPLNENQELNVKAGSTITIEAIPGYKIKSVKVKKGGAGGLKTPLTMEALTDGTIVVKYPKEGMQYTLNGGEKNTFSKPTYDNIIEVKAGDKVAFYGNGTSITKYFNTNIHGGTADVKLYGNIMSLLDEENYATATSLENCEEEVFCFLFGSTSTETHLIDAGDLLLPATTLTNSCYASMFQNCTSLTTAPALPATTLVQNCYMGMFYGCTSLTTLPEGMLPATEMQVSCYHSMFRGCTSLTTAPALPATTLASTCYTAMFQDCSSLTTAPELPATTLANSCYLTMFQNCTSLTTAPVLPAETLLSSSYNRMFYGCSSLNSVTCLAINIPDGSTSYWLSGVAASGTFIKAASKNNWPRNVNGIPNGWTIQNYEP